MAFQFSLVFITYAALFIILDTIFLKQVSKVRKDHLADLYKNKKFSDDVILHLISYALQIYGVFHFVVALSDHYYNLALYGMCTLGIQVIAKLGSTNKKQLQEGALDLAWAALLPGICYYVSTKFMQ
mmetsp:Transcript_11611/g.17177  ORF Transcript_11611/g.17177 Transcript_11611/m.17177 type:complete len:127 (+) Transcript_11611:59-439(+)